MGEFKEGAVLAYNRLAEVWSAPSRPCAQGLAVCVEEEGGEARTQPRPVEDVSTAASAQPAKDEDIEYFDVRAATLPAAALISAALATVMRVSSRLLRSNRLTRWHCWWTATCARPC